MRHVRISGADPKPLGAPADWSEDRDGHCGALFVRRERDGGVDYMRSAWEVESNEAALLYAGAHLTLGIAGNRHPVVQLGVGDVPADFEPVMLARRFTSTDGRPSVRVEMFFPHGGGRSAYSNVHVDGTLADAISRGLGHIEQLAHEQGWIA